LIFGCGKWLLKPDCLSRSRIKSLNEAHPVRAVEHTIDHDRRRSEVRGNVERRVLCGKTWIDSGTAPQDLHLPNVVLVDLIQRRVLRGAAVTAVTPPLAIYGAVLRGSRSQRESEQDCQPDQNSYLTHHASPESLAIIDSPQPRVLDP